MICDTGGKMADSLSMAKSTRTIMLRSQCLRGGWKDEGADMGESPLNLPRL